MKIEDILDLSEDRGQIQKIEDSLSIRKYHLAKIEVNVRIFSISPHSSGGYKFFILNFSNINSR